MHWFSFCIIMPLCDRAASTALLRAAEASDTLQLEGAITSTEKHILAQNQDHAALKVRVLLASRQSASYRFKLRSHEPHSL